VVRVFGRKRLVALGAAQHGPVVQGEVLDHVARSDEAGEAHRARPALVFFYPRLCLVFTALISIHTPQQFYFVLAWG
jgi:hypothetical protein